MDINSLIRQYFDLSHTPTIDVFDNDTIEDLW